LPNIAARENWRFNHRNAQTAHDFLSFDTATTARRTKIHFLIDLDLGRDRHESLLCYFVDSRSWKQQQQQQQPRHLQLIITVVV
jgi:hypothetical protein